MGESLGKPWTKAEEQILIDGAGVFAVAWFERKLGRSRDAIEARARKLFGPGGLSRGTHSLNSMVGDTGYTKEQILRARSALDQKWKRLGPRGRYLITFEQRNEIIGWLKGDYWCASLRLYRCVNCGTDKRSVAGMGLCTTCYPRIRRALKAAGQKPDFKSLRALVATTPGNAVDLRVLREQVAKGRGPTEAQLAALLAAIPSA